MKSHFRKLVFAAVVFATATTIISLTVKDRWPLVSIIYYASPWLLRLFAAVVALIFYPKRRSLQIMAAVCLTVAIFQAKESYRNDPPATASSSLKVSFWNGARGFDEEPALWNVHGNADLFAMVETGNFSDKDWTRFKATYPAHDCQRLGDSMLIGVRGKILSQESIGLDERLRAFRVLVSLPGQGEFQVIAIDVRSSVWISRDVALAKILTESRHDPRCIILGDFNTPSQSHFLDLWRENGLTLANDGPRRGFQETWAYGLPLLTLDQIWTGGDWKSISATVSRPSHDHSRVEVILAPGNGQ